MRLEVRVDVAIAKMVSRRFNGMRESHALVIAVARNDARDDRLEQPG